VADCGRRVEMLIETKHPTRYGGLVERRLVETLRHFGWDRPGSPVRVMSFSFTALQRVERLAPDLRLVMLIERARNWPMLRSVVGPDWLLGPGIDQLTRHPKFAERMRRSGRELNVWTVNDGPQLDLCLELGVRALITDRPRYLLDRLAPDP
jgi:glycerophosphoryl diester phosphodiesterase